MVEWLRCLNVLASMRSLSLARPAICVHDLDNLSAFASVDSPMISANFPGRVCHRAMNTLLKWFLKINILKKCYHSIGIATKSCIAFHEATYQVYYQRLFSKCSRANTYEANKIWNEINNPHIFQHRAVNQTSCLYDRPCYMLYTNCENNKDNKSVILSNSLS